MSGVLLCTALHHAVRLAARASVTLRAAHAGRATGCSHHVCMGISRHDEACSIAHLRIGATSLSFPPSCRTSHCVLARRTPRRHVRPHAARHGNRHSAYQGRACLSRFKLQLKRWSWCRRRRGCQLRYRCCSFRFCFCFGYCGQRERSSSYCSFGGVGWACCSRRLSARGTGCGYRRRGLHEGE